MMIATVPAGTYPNPGSAKAEWCKDFGNVLTLGTHLVDLCEITTAKELLYFFEKPWKWTEEWNSYLLAKQIGAI